MKYPGLFFVPVFLIFASTLTLHPAEASAQEENLTTTEQNDSQTLKVDQEKIKAYASAAITLGQIHNSTRPQIEAAKDADQKKALLKRMQLKMIKAIEQTKGITLSEYNRISKAVQENKTLYEQIRQTIAKLTGQPPKMVK